MMSKPELPPAPAPVPVRRRPDTRRPGTGPQAAEPIVCCWHLVRCALTAAQFSCEEMAELAPLYGDPERRAVARVIEHLERALEELRPLGPGWASP